MKTLKLIALMLLTANFVIAQSGSYFAPNQGQTGTNNTYLGQFAAGSQATGVANVALGAYTFLGGEGNHNMMMGFYAGASIESSRNIIIGANAGKNFGKGSTEPNINNRGGNIAIGFASGFHTKGDRNVFIGYWAGSDVSLADASDQLYIQNSSDVTTPLIYGDFAKKKVGIGTSDVPDEYALAVKGHIVAEEVTINLYDANNGGWPDYVFAEDYELMPLNELETEIETLGHLPGVPSAEEVEENGHNVGQMNAILLEKVEELTLHLIDMNKSIETLQQSEKELREENKALKSAINK